MSVVERACAVGALLGEGPIWYDGALWFVDIKQHLVHRFSPMNNKLDTWVAPAQVGWVQPYAGNGMLAGLQTGLHRFNPDDGSFIPFAVVEADRLGNRLNDSCVDASGRLWFGSMDDRESAPTGRIFRADASGIAMMIDGIVITNGPAVSPDGTTLYYCDTLAGTIYRCMIGDDGTLSGNSVFAQVDTATQGYPDGPIVDAENHVWVGYFAGWCVRRYAPDGQQVAEIRLPVSNVTKIAIGGADGQTAYVTTAAKGLSKIERVEQPFAGDVFTFNAGVTGQAASVINALETELL